MWTPTGNRCGHFDRGFALVHKLFSALGPCLRAATRNYPRSRHLGNGQELSHSAQSAILLLGCSRTASRATSSVKQHEDTVSGCHGAGQADTEPCQCSIADAAVRAVPARPATPPPMLATVCLCLGVGAAIWAACLRDAPSCAQGWREYVPSLPIPPIPPISALSFVSFTGNPNSKFQQTK